jgi:hypothetical protein
MIGAFPIALKRTTTFALSFFLYVSSAEMAAAGYVGSPDVDCVALAVDVTGAVVSTLGERTPAPIAGPAMLGIGLPRGAADRIGEALFDKVSVPGSVALPVSGDKGCDAIVGYRWSERCRYWYYTTVESNSTQQATSSDHSETTTARVSHLDPPHPKRNLALSVANTWSEQMDSPETDSRPSYDASAQSGQARRGPNPNRDYKRHFNRQKERYNTVTADQVNRKKELNRASAKQWKLQDEIE